MTPKAFLLALCIAWIVGGCAVAPPSYLAKPADPTIKVPALAYQSVISQTRTYRPVGPKDWEEINRRVGPQR